LTPVNSAEFAFEANFGFWFGRPTFQAADRVEPVCCNFIWRIKAAMMNLTLARKVIAAAEKKAAEIGQPMNIAVVDEGGNLVTHVRMDGAWIGSIDISINKAFTSRAFDITTKDLAEHSQSGGQFFGIHVSNHGRIMIFAGGIPIRMDGKVIGAIGVSGGSGEQDHSVAEAGAGVVS
jgi:uncharacterized protein GlcG (DUF336 family)